VTADVLFVVFLSDFEIGDIQGLQKRPFVVAWALGEEVEEDHIVEFKTFGFVDGQTQSMLQNDGNSIFTFLVPNDDDLVASELQGTLFDCVVSLFQFLLLASTEDVEEQLLVAGRQDHRLGAMEIRNFFPHAIDGLGEEQFDGGNNRVGQLKNVVVRSKVYGEVFDGGSFELDRGVEDTRVEQRLQITEPEADSLGDGLSSVT
jgi:hypothetical protein